MAMASAEFAPFEQNTEGNANAGVEIGYYDLAQGEHAEGFWDDGDLIAAEAAYFPEVYPVSNTGSSSRSFWCRPVFALMFGLLMGFLLSRGSIFPGKRDSSQFVMYDDDPHEVSSVVSMFKLHVDHPARFERVYKGLL